MWYCFLSCSSVVVEAQEKDPKAEVHFAIQPQSAQLWINDVEQSRRDVSLVAGRHLVRVSHEGYVSYTQWIEIAKDSKETQDITLQPQMFASRVYIQEAHLISLTNATNKEWNVENGEEVLLPYGSYVIKAQKEDGTNMEKVWSQHLARPGYPKHPENKHAA